MKRILCLALLLATLFGSFNVAAVEPSERLSDPQLEQRARTISTGLRCPVCQNQSIDDSDAQLAKDLRLIVRQRLLAGDSDDDVKQYLVVRYGDYILLQPPLKATTALLWLGPALIFIITMIWLFFFYRSPKTEKTITPLSAKEKQNLDNLTQNNG